MVRFTESVRVGWGRGQGSVSLAVLSFAHESAALHAASYVDTVRTPYTYALLLRVACRLGLRAPERCANGELSRLLALCVNLRFVVCDSCPLGLVPADRRAAGGRLCREPLVGKYLK